MSGKKIRPVFYLFKKTYFSPIIAPVNTKYFVNF